MGSDYLGDVYTLADIASAADSTEDEVLAAAGGSRRLWSYADAVRIGRLLVAKQYATGSTLDGPTIAQPSRGQKNYQRISGILPAGSSSSWRITSGTTSATPGFGEQSTGANLIYISEVSDFGGTGNYTHEFIEIFVE